VEDREGSSILRLLPWSDPDPDPDDDVRMLY
jgi:hypothetical protein